ncbi:phosphoribulokinase [Actinophytocola sp.]|jgi:phosphoribulokinase|uniref:phosphoribulokinase n=1 Tax=Actinophytocola sp. TaxID=1872138 RepID=UPI002EDAEF13
MPDKAVRIARAAADQRPRRPVLLAIAGDSAAGKTTLTRGLVQALGPERCVAVCVDDYHRFDRLERRGKPFTALHPDCNHVEIMEQHLQLLATGQPILKPVYDHSTGQLARPELVEPNDFIIVEGLLPLVSKLSRACFEVAVFLNPPEDIRRGWKVARDTAKRGYTAEQVHAELDRREAESAAHIRPQQHHADIVVRFAPIPVRDDPPGTPLSAELMLRPTIRHPDLNAVLVPTNHRAIHLKLERDPDGRPCDTLHVHGYVPNEEARTVQKAIWSTLDQPGEPPPCLGQITPTRRSEPMAITQLLLLYHLLNAST